ncbi:MAG: PEP-CTERM sorting domain-containing protein [Puniceicoccales bacterium]
MKNKIVTPSLVIVASIAATSLASALSVINPNTDYTSSNFSGESLEASAADLGSARFFAANLSNTSWSASGATTTPDFSAITNQNFRQAIFDDADWSGLTFTTDGGAGNQYFYQASFVNANFSNAVFDLNASNIISEAFKDADLTGANFSGASITTTSSDIFEGATMGATTNFSNATLMLGDSNTLANLVSAVGVNFSGATIRIDLQGTDLSNANFQNVTTVTSDGFNTIFRESLVNNTDFRGTDFSGVGFANWLPSLTFDEGSAPLYDDNTIFTTQNGTFDPVAAGWTYAPIPEPSTYAAFAGVLVLGLALMKRRMKRA